ncbi:MAG: cobyric acid synthase [Myxococcota bacterium]|nr:cobyric acid synthase [Myxococcota bacterium]
MTTAIMVLGTASGVGKSWVSTGLCRLLARRGLRVRPFKAQNMSNNASPARMHDGGWGEIGRAQAAQARAAYQEPHVDMNPLLLKPTGAMGSQIVLEGRAIGHKKARDYYKELDGWFGRITAAYDRLAAASDVVVLEGAGSPVEINLMHRDIVNLRMARHALRSSDAGGLILVGDIHRGGVFASLLGTLEFMPRDDRARVAGVIINRFMGDPTLLAPGPEMFTERTGIPVLGVLPLRRDIHVDEEDGQDVAAAGAGAIDVCVVRLPTVSNFTDVSGLARAAGVRVRYVREPAAVGNPDLLVLPGAKDTLSDLAWMRRTGMDRIVQAAAARGVPTLGLCGGYQLLGESLADADGVGGTAGRVPGLGLLPVHTAFSRKKHVREVSGTTRPGWLLPADLPVRGYEIHQGETPASDAPLVTLDGPDGAVAGCVAGTYLHGLLDTAEVAVALVDALRARRGLAPSAEAVPDLAAWREAQYDAAADLIEAHIDLQGILP